MPPLDVESVTSGSPILLADIGGTHARFAWQARSGAPLESVQVLHCKDYAGLAEAVQHWLKINDLPAPGKAALALACPVRSDHVQLTNNSWSFSIQALQATLGLQKLIVVNDFTALALALPLLDPANLLQLGGDPQAPFAQREPVALLGAGTGLGVSGLLPNPQGGWTALSGEGGHCSLACHDDQQFRVWSVLKERYGHVSGEHVLSGQGIVNIHSSLRFLNMGYWPSSELSSSEITTLALSQSDPLAVQTLHLFCNWLGSVAGDLALTLGAIGGVFIGGGIPPRLKEFLGPSGFRASFESKGRYSTYLSTIPVWLIDAPTSPALKGVATLLD
jgi:glucokinase